MGLFTKKQEGGMMDVIRCDEREYLIWKWSPAGVPSRRENAIRYGSTLRVKDGEVAVFVYKSNSGAMQDFIEGPTDETIKTANFPILSGIVGSAFGGSSPFPAEIYFINLAGNIVIPYFVKEFNVSDPRFTDIRVPVTCSGTLIINITDYKKFIKMNRMIQFDIEDLKKQIEAIIRRYTKSVITNAPTSLNMSIMQIERGLDEINVQIFNKSKPELEDTFGINIKRLDISDITLNEESDGYIDLRTITADVQQEILLAQKDANIANIHDMQSINAVNMEESLRIQREETQRAQRLNTESTHLTAHQINVQGAVGLAAAESLGQLGGGGGDGMGGGGGGFNPAAMVSGVMMGGAVGGSMAGMMNTAMQGVNTPQPPSAPMGAIAEYFVAVNGQQTGPFTVMQLKQMVGSGQMTKESHIWKQGMGNWEMAINVPDVAQLFAAMPPPMVAPPAPPTPPVPPAL